MGTVPQVTGAVLEMPTRGLPVTNPNWKMLLIREKVMLIFMTSVIMLFFLCHMLVVQDTRFNISKM
jgi:hypothetical protein